MIGSPGTPMDPAAATTEPLPALPGFPFLHAGSGSMIVGPTGRGRSSLIQACLYDAAIAGENCAYLGCEVTADEFNVRAAILAKLRGDRVDDEIRARLAHIRYLDLGSVIVQGWTNPQVWVELIASRYRLIALDPLSAAAAALDLDFDKSNHDFIRFYDRLIQPLTAQGVTVAIVDNVGHAEEARTRAKGASAKSDRADLTFSCSLSTTPPGLIVKAGKVRSVRAGFQRGDEWLFSKDTQRIAPRERSGVEQHTAFRPTNIMQKVSEALEHDAGLTKRTIRTTIGGNKSNVDLALELLIAENFVEVRRDGQAHHHHSVKPFREATVPTVPTPWPDRAPATVTTTVPNRVPPLKGGTGLDGHGSEELQSNNRAPDADAELERVGNKFQEAI